MRAHWVFVSVLMGLAILFAVYPDQFRAVVTWIERALK
jgi:hypothetical protein